MTATVMVRGQAVVPSSDRLVSRDITSGTSATPACEAIEQMVANVVW
ncbi:MAG: hypothetical protein WEB06_13785 [Actinomycetota bacterium]